MSQLLKGVRLLRGLLDGERTHTGPVFVNVDVTRRCNLRCLGCQYHNSPKRAAHNTGYNVRDMPLELIDRICSSLPELDTHEVFLLGQGEPLLHPQLQSIIERFKRAGCRVELFTNGTRIDEHAATVLARTGLDVVRVSLWGTTSEEYRRCYPGGDPTNLQRALDGVEALARARSRFGMSAPRLLLTTPINRHNHRGLEARIRLARRLGCDGVRFDVFRHYGEHAEEGLSAEQVAWLCERLGTLQALARSLSLSENLDELLLNYRLGEHEWRLRPCYVGWFHCRVHVDGRVLPCSSCNVTLGNLRERSLAEIWNGEPYRAFRRRMLSQSGQGALLPDCCCDWCCLAKSNHRVHRFYRWIAPLVRARGGP